MRYALFFIFCLLIAAPAVAEAPGFDAEKRARVQAMMPMTAVPAPDLAGRIVVVAFFASWCPPCVDEFRELNALRARLPAPRVEIIALNVFEAVFKKNQEVRLARFIDRTAPRFALLSGKTDREISDLFGGVTRIPTVFVFDPKGGLIAQFVHQKGAPAGQRHAEAGALEAAIRPLLAGE